MNPKTTLMKSTPTIISKKASNWVDRGESAVPRLRRVLAYFFERDLEVDQAWLDAHANTVIGMVAADATEAQIAGYLNSVVRETGAPTRTPLGARSTAVGLWHIAKAALVRDFAERVLQGDVPMNAPMALARCGLVSWPRRAATGTQQTTPMRVPMNAPTSDSFSHWVASRLLTPEELSRFEAEARATDTQEDPSV